MLHCVRQFTLAQLSRRLGAGAVSFGGCATPVRPRVAIKRSLGLPSRTTVTLRSHDNPTASDEFPDRRRRRCGVDSRSRTRSGRQKSNHRRSAKPVRRTHLSAAHSGIRLRGGVMDAAARSPIALGIERERGITWPASSTTALMSLPAAFRPAPVPVTTTTMPAFGSSRCWQRDKFRLPSLTTSPTWRNGCP